MMEVISGNIVENLFSYLLTGSGNIFLVATDFSSCI